MKTWTSGLLQVMTTVVLAWALSACSTDDPAGPTGTLPDPTVASDVLDELSAGLTENEAITSLNVLGPYISQIGGQPALAGDAPHAPQRLPESALGMTFVWNADFYQYEADAERTGAPADGARFVIYDIDENTFLPSLPLSEIGYVDLRDLSSGESIDIQHDVILDSGSSLVMDMTGTLTSTSADLTTVGTLTLDGSTIAFTYGLQGTQGGAFALTVEAESAPYSVDWSHSRQGEFGQGPGADLLTVSDGTSTVEFVVNWDAAYNVTGASVVEVNDVVVADVTGFGGFVEVQPRDGFGLDESDGFLIADAYFDALLLNAYVIAATTLMLTNTGRTLPSF